MAEHPTDQSSSSRLTRLVSLRRYLPALLLPVLIWAAGSLFLGGDLGKSSDDYFLNLRDPATNVVPPGVGLYEHFPYFWRPLHIAMTFFGGTYFWEHDRALHIFVAAMHALACLGLWLLLRRTLRSNIAPIAATLLFMTQPINHEVVFWFSTACTSIGAAIFFVVALLTVRFARMQRGGWSLLLPIAVATFLIPCFYEQSAAGVAALPALVLAVCPRSQTWLSRAVRACGVTVAAGIMCLLYIAIFRATAPADARGGAGTTVSLERLPVRAAEVGRAVADRLWGQYAEHTWKGSLRQGWDAVASPEGVVWAGLILAAAITWLVWVWQRGAASPEPEHRSQALDERPVIRRLWLALFGLGMFLAAWLPTTVLDTQNVVPRNFYVPLIGLAIALAAALDAIMSAVTVRRVDSTLARATATAIGMLALACAVVGSVGLIGFQSYVQSRWRLDQSEIRQLRELVADPQTGTIFLPMETALSTAARTGLLRYDRCRPGVFETTWSANSVVQRAYERGDVFSAGCNPWVALPNVLSEPTESDVRYAGSIGHGLPGHPDGGTALPWAQVVPFTIGADGRVRLVRRVDIEKPDHRDLVIRPPLVQRVIAARRAQGLTTPVTTISLPHIEQRLDLIPIDMWEWDKSRELVKFSEVWIWANNGRGVVHGSLPRRATWLHALADGGARSAFSMGMPGRERTELLLIRATIAEYDLQQVGLLPPTAGQHPPPAPAARRPVAVQELVVSFASRPDQPLGVLRLDPAELASSKRWLPLIAEIPGSAHPDRWVVRVRAAPDQPKNARLLPIWVTAGFEQLPPISPNLPVPAEPSAVPAAPVLVPAHP